MRPGACGGMRVFVVACGGACILHMGCLLSSHFMGTGSQSMPVVQQDLRLIQERQALSLFRDSRLPSSGLSVGIPTSGRICRPASALALPLFQAVKFSASQACSGARA
ncbi:hypothetical protein DER45DRAFT_575198 [Fusarium avenaceum]|nr:hypothetical protein DER45DRAFT_575198 [Fusarium avenaceum]